MLELYMRSVCKSPYLLPFTCFSGGLREVAVSSQLFSLLPLFKRTPLTEMHIFGFYTHLNVYSHDAHADHYKFLSKGDSV